jgi:DNA-binding MarR family transcriptional regulator
MRASREETMLAIDGLLRETFGRYLRRPKPPEPDDLTLAQAHCLHTIGDMESPTMSELSAELELHPSTVTALVDALVKRGLVQRMEDPDDRRIVRVAFTSEGRRGRDRIRQVMQARMIDLLGDVPDPDLAKVHEGLSILHAAAVRRAERTARVEQGSEDGGADDD